MADGAGAPAGEGDDDAAGSLRPGSSAEPLALGSAWPTAGSTPAWAEDADRAARLRRESRKARSDEVDAAQPEPAGPHSPPSGQPSPPRNGRSAPPPIRRLSGSSRGWHRPPPRPSPGPPTRRRYPTPVPRPGPVGGPRRKKRNGWLIAAAVFVAVNMVDNVVDGLFGSTVESLPPEAVGVPGLGSSPELMVPAASGELVDVGTFEPQPAGIFDPSGAFALPDLQVTSALYDGLTDFLPDAAGPPVPQPAVAERWDVSEDARVWTFHVRRGLTFSDSTPVLPSSFVRGWERATGPYGGPLSHLFAPIEGATPKLLGEASTITGLLADDEAMTLRVSLAKPMAEFDSVVAHPLFSPLPAAADMAPDQAAWGHASPSDIASSTVVGNGPFVQEWPTLLWQDVHLVPNPQWDGTRYGPGLGLPARPQVNRLTFRVANRSDAEQAMLVAGVTRTVNDDGTAATPSAFAPSDYWSTAERPLAGAAFLSFDWDDPVVGGPDNVGLRRAIGLALDRPGIDELYEAPSRPANALTPPELSGGERPCETPGCDVQVERARQALTEWQAAGGRLDAPIEIVHDNSRDDLAIGQALVGQLEAVGIPARSVALEPGAYRQAVDTGSCQVCWRTWSTTVPTVGGLLRQLLAQDYVTPGNTGGYASPDVGRGLEEAAAVRDPAARAAAYREVEAQALADGAVVPVLWTTGDYLYNERVTSFPQHMSGLVAWERVTIP